MDNFKEIVQRCFEENQAGGWEPDKTGTRYQTVLWRMCRLLKGDKVMSVLSPTQQLAAVEEALRPHEFCDFIGIESNADGRAEFLKTMKRIRLAEGQEPLAIAWSNLPQKQYPTAKTGFRDPQYLKLIALADSLQKIMGREPIYLPCREVAALLGVGRQTVSTYRSLMEEDGYLTVVAPHSFGGHRATLFRFHAPLDTSMSK